MKNAVTLIVLSIFLSCDDGDLTIDSVDFDSIETAQTCDTVSTTTDSVLFKINGDEALILEVASGTFKNEVSTEIIEQEISTTTKLTYRIFSDDVSSDYFCDDLPPISPIVIEEVTAEDGTVFITTTTTDSVTFSHLIQLSEISFITSDGSRITDLQINEYGTVTTSL